MEEIVVTAPAVMSSPIVIAALRLQSPSILKKRGASLGTRERAAGAAQSSGGGLILWFVGVWWEHHQL